MFSIQRVPQGLLNLLSIREGSTPQALEENICGVLELLQYYGLTQRQVLQGSAAAAVVGSQTSLGAGGGSALPTNAWAILFGAYAFVTKAAAMTDLGFSIALRRGSGLYTHVAFNSQPHVFGAADGSEGVAFTAPYPILLPPGSDIAVNLGILNGVANAAVSIGADVGVLG